MPRLLDLFCGGGGASMGFHRAGFEVVGVDIAPQKHYPFDFIQADALEYVREHRREFDAIAASPPCQSYSRLKHRSNGTHPELVEETRAVLQRTGKPWVIENVVGAPLYRPLMLCGSMFRLQTSCGAQLRRHRLFESNVLLMSPGECEHDYKSQHAISVAGSGASRGQRRVISVNGHEFRDEKGRNAERRARTITVTGSTPQQNVERNVIRESFSIVEARIAMGIDWMPMKSLSQAIPPAYTEWIGKQLLRYLEVKHADITR